MVKSMILVLVFFFCFESYFLNSDPDIRNSQRKEKVTETQCLFNGREYIKMVSSRTGREGIGLSISVLCFSGHVSAEKQKGMPPQSHGFFRNHPSGSMGRIDS